MNIHGVMLDLEASGAMLLKEIFLKYEELMKIPGKTVPLELPLEYGTRGVRVGECRLLMAFSPVDYAWVARLDRGVETEPTPSLEVDASGVHSLTGGSHEQTEEDGGTGQR